MKIQHTNQVFNFNIKPYGSNENYHRIMWQTSKLSFVRPTLSLSLSLVAERRIKTRRGKYENKFSVTRACCTEYIPFA